MSRGATFALLGGVAIVLALFTAYVLTSDCNGIKQAINMKAARDHADAIGAHIHADPRFLRVDLVDYTGGVCGCLMARGDVSSEADALALREAIAATHPPVQVVFALSIPSPDLPEYTIHLPVSEIPTPR